MSSKNLPTEKSSLMDMVRDFPQHTCPASRHAYRIGAALAKRLKYPMLQESPEHCGESILDTVRALWDVRAENARLIEVIAGMLMSVRADDGTPPA